MPSTVPPDDDWTGETGHGLTGEPDDETFRPAPHPDDRLWRHPSEAMAMHPAGGARAGDRRQPAKGRGPRRRATRNPEGRLSPPKVSWTLMVLASAAGAAAAAGALTALGAREGAEERPATEDIAMAPSESSEAEEAIGDALAVPDTSAAEPSTVRVEGPDSTGSGLVLDDDGVVLTGISVVQQVGSAASRAQGGNGSATRVSVTLADGSEAAGAVVGADELTGVAVLRLPEPSSGQYQGAALLEGSRARSGMGVTVLGRLADGGMTATTGVVTSSAWSPQDRQDFTLQGLLQIGLRSGSGSGTTEEADETSGLVEPAAPGSPVLNEDGAVVGMATTATSQGWLYAVPIDVAAKVANDILENGGARHAWLGIRGRDSMGPAAGVLVTNVTPEGPAGGRLEEDDVIVAANGVPVPDMATLQATLLLYGPGDAVPVTYHREDGTGAETVEVILADRPADLE